MTDERQEGLRAAVEALCNFAGRHIAGDSDVQREDVYAAIEEVRAALAVAQVPERLDVERLARAAHNADEGCAAMHHSALTPYTNLVQSMHEAAIRAIEREYRVAATPSAQDKTP